MAINSAEKRRNVAGIPFTPGGGVTPNTAKDLEWRQEAGFGYGGIDALFISPTNRPVSASAGITGGRGIATKSGGSGSATITGGSARGSIGLT